MKSVILGAALALSFASSAFAVNPTDGLPDIVKNLHKAMSNNGCQEDTFGGPDIYDLGKGKTLYLVPCMNGAYQSSYNGYITWNADYVTPVIVLNTIDGKTTVGGTTDLMEAGYNDKTGELTTFAKGRGIGDCGESSVSKIIVDEYQVTVKTIEVRSKSKCDGKMTGWPVVFKQK